MTAEQAKELERKANEIRKARLILQRYDRAKQLVKEEERKKKQYEHGRSVTGKILKETFKISKQALKAVLKESRKK